MDIDSDFPTKVETIGDVPEPLRRALKDNIPPNEQIRLIIYSPAFSKSDHCHPVERCYRC
jgi:hypothetical protein